MKMHDAVQHKTDLRMTRLAIGMATGACDIYGQSKCCDAPCPHCSMCAIDNSCIAISPVEAPAEAPWLPDASSVCLHRNWLRCVLLVQHFPGVQAASITRECQAAHVVLFSFKSTCLASHH